MERNFYPTDKSKNVIAIGLLPYYFKKIGIAVFVLAFVPAIIARAVNIPLTPTSKEVVRLLSMNAFILGLLFIAWARDKVEDELTIAIRQKSMVMAFLLTPLYVIIKPFIDMLVKSPIADIKGQELVFNMLLGYLLLYFLQKKGR